MGLKEELKMESNLHSEQLNVRDLKRKNRKLVVIIIIIAVVAVILAIL